jgi:hypothetical protein
MKHNSKIINPVIIEIRPSRLIPGEIGLFAVRALKKDTIIALASMLAERFFPWSAYKELDKLTQGKVDNFTMQTEEGFYLPPDFNYLSVPWNMNHSCDYNVGFDKAGNFITAKNIKAGQELLLDYGMFFSDPKFKMKCKCGSKNCRKQITGNDWKDKKFMEKNKRYFLRELILKAKSK